MARAPTGTPFSRLAVTHGLSVGADTLVAVALAGSIFFDVSADSARPKVLLYLAVTMVPFAVVAPLIGPAIDRAGGERRLAVGLSAAGRGLLCLLMTRHLDSLLFYPEAFGVLALSKGYAVAKSALVPAVVPSDGALVEANARLALIAALAGFALFPVGVGLEALTDDARWVLGAAVAVNAAALVAALRIPAATRPGVPAAPVEQAELRAASVALAATAMAVLRAGVGFLTFLAAFVAKRDGAPTWYFGLLLAAGAAGGLAGALVAPRLSRAVRAEAILAGALLAPAVVTVFAARGFSRTALCLVAVAVALGAAAARPAFDSLVQRDAPDARGRAFARFETRFQLVWVAGAFVPVALNVSGRLGLLILALGLGFAGLAYVAGFRAVPHAGSGHRT